MHCKPNKIDIDIDYFVECWRKQEWPDENIYSTRKILGRICRGKTNEDFMSFTEGSADESKVAFLLRDKSLKELMEANKKGGPMELFNFVGFESKYVKEKLAKGYQFQLLFFHCEEVEFFKADWNGVLNLIGEIYPDLNHHLHSKDQMIKELKKITIDEVNQKLNCCLFNARSEYDRNKNKEHKHFYDLKKMSQINSPNIYEWRAFIYHKIGCRELYKGDGFTYDENGNKKGKEYIMINKLRNEVSSLRVETLTVSNN